jgi:hypothetical protein
MSIRLRMISLRALPRVVVLVVSPTGVEGHAGFPIHAGQAGFRDVLFRRDEVAVLRIHPVGHVVGSHAAESGLGNAEEPVVHDHLRLFGPDFAPSDPSPSRPHRPGNQWQL